MSALPPPRERQRGEPPEQRRSEDEEGGGGAGGGDPAVLAVGPARSRLQYSRDRLLGMRNAPMSRAHPGIEHEAFNNIRKRTESPEDDRGARGDAPGDNHKGYQRGERRAADPRERVRKESEPSGAGIVLSPQRRSFTSGCQAPGAAVPTPHIAARTRPESPLASTKPEPAVRRIGSGRILRTVCDVTQPPWERGAAGGGGEARDAGRDEPEPEPVRTYSSQPYRPPPAVARDRGDDRFERRSFGRDSFGTDVKRDRDDRYGNDKRDRDDNRRSGRYGNQRRYEKEIAEPEWYSGGPTSQLETIELRGFDEPVRDKKTNGSAKDSEKWGNGGRSPPSSSSERWRSSGAGSSPPARATPTPNPERQTNEEKDNTRPPSREPREDAGARRGREEATRPPSDDDFNLDDFLKFDSIPELLTNGTGESNGGSRFSRWFQRSESPASHHEQLFNNMMDDLESASADPPHLFAPISPAGSGGGAGAPGPPPPSLLELLQRANAASGAPHAQPHEMNSGPTKIQSLEELEARMLGHTPHQPAPPQRQPQHDLGSAQDLAAFKRLLAQVSGGHAVHANSEPAPPPQHHKPQPMSLLQMLNKSMNAENQQKLQQQQQQQQQQPPHIPPEVLYKLLQVQRQQQQEMATGSADRELLQRTEAQAILHGLRHGDLTPQHLVQQLSNPGLQSRHRDMLVSILRHTSHRQPHHSQMGGSPLPGAGAPHLIVPPHHQQLRVSPLPHGGVQQPTLSPHELAMHTKNIMQNALIKKKLEEQRENYRRRYEQPKQSTPISFTPTSVLRKMTADKDEPPSGVKLPAPQPHWAHVPHKVPQGRPIVKGNQGGMGAPTHGAGLFPPHSEPSSQQHFLNHQQMSANRPYPQPPQRQSASHIDNLYMNSRGGGAGNPLQQLFVQSHHRTINEMGGGVGGLSGLGGEAAGTANRLERWFSPELLAQAQAGKLPSVHVPNALSLEDLERNHHSATVRN